MMLSIHDEQALAAVVFQTTSRATLPTIDWPEGTRLNDVIVAMAEGLNLEVHGVIASKSVVPAWAVRHAPADLQMFEPTGEPIDFAMTSPLLKSEPVDAAARFVETRLWRDGLRTAGVTTVVPDSKGRMAIEIPDTVQILSVTGSGGPVDLVDRPFRVPITTEGKPLILRWKSDEESDQFSAPWPRLRTGDTFFVLLGESANATCDDATIVTADDYQASRRQAGLLSSQPADRILAFNSEASRPAFGTTNSSARDPVAAVALCFVALIASGWLVFASNRVRASVVPGVLGLILLLTGVPIAGLIFIGLAIVAWRFVPAVVQPMVATR